MNNPHVYSTHTLDFLPPEIILIVMKLLPTFQDLNSFIRSSSSINLLFKLNEYGVCGAVCGLQFEGLSKEYKDLLYQLKGLTDYLHLERSLHGSSVSGSNLVGRGESAEKLCLGIFKGGTKIGVAEATKILVFTRKFSKLKVSIAGYLSIDTGTTTSPDTYMISPNETLRINRTLFKYYSLLLACVPGWIQERSLISLRSNNFRSVIDHDTRIHITAETLKLTRSRVEPFLQYKRQEIRDMYMIPNVACGLELGIPRDCFDQEVRWSKLDDQCVQLDAGAHIERVWKSRGGFMQDLVNIHQYSHAESACESINL